MQFQDLLNAATFEGAKPSAKVFAVDQFGVTQSPVTDVRLDDEGNIILDIEVPEN